jgi:hypothetical protein
MERRTKNTAGGKNLDSATRYALFLLAYQVFNSGPSESRNNRSEAATIDPSFIGVRS